jgi:voltage-gated potassium channel
LHWCSSKFLPFSTAYENWFHFFDIFSVVVFTIEYLVRFYLAPEDEEFKKRKYARGSYVVSPFALIDLIAILPFFLQAFISVDLRYLRSLRLLRILKLFRILIPAYKEFVLPTKAEPSDKKFTQWCSQVPTVAVCTPSSTPSL